jgi:hypothetical protein
VEAPHELAALQEGLPPEYQHLERIVVGRALVYRGEVRLDPLPNTRRIAIVFSGRPSRIRPIVMADGPRTARHRFIMYRPMPLCLWYDGDGPDQKWRPANGLGELIDIIRVHLLREARFRQTGRWRGPERHFDVAGRPTNRALRRALERDRPRVKCWCGSGRRYIRCHGEIAEERELAVLGLLRRASALREAA